MSMDWFRWYHGTVSDPKFAAICLTAVAVDSSQLGVPL